MTMETTISGHIKDSFCTSFFFLGGFVKYSWGAMGFNPPYGETDVLNGPYDKGNHYMISCN